jgi:hypothetical protein
MSKNLQAAFAAAETLRRRGGNTLGHFGRTRSPPTAHASRQHQRHHIGHGLAAFLQLGLMRIMIVAGDSSAAFRANRSTRGGPAADVVASRR